MRKTLGGLDYTRCVEYPRALRALELGRARRVLEIGSSKLFLAPYIADTYDVELHATDLDPAVELQRRRIEAIGRSDLLASGTFTVRIEIRGA